MPNHVTLCYDSWLKVPKGVQQKLPMSYTVGNQYSLSVYLSIVRIRCPRTYRCDQLLIFCKIYTTNAFFKLQYPDGTMQEVSDDTEFGVLECLKSNTIFHPGWTGKPGHYLTRDHFSSCVATHTGWVTQMHPV